MFGEWVATLPGWLVAGVALGAFASAGVAAVFLAANRWFPSPSLPGGARSDGYARRRAEIREYLGLIGERYLEDHDLDGRCVAFYLPERDVAITFDAKAYFRLAADGSRSTRVVLCEHEMPGHQLGRRLPFDVPDVYRGPDPDPVATAFETLGLSADADESAVERAYRDRVKQVHPDQGGSREAFTEVREAYATALAHAGEAR